MNTEAIEQAEKTADRIREELFRTVDEIDRRRIEAMDWRRQVRAAAPVAAIAGAAVVGIVVTRILLSRREREHEHRKLRRERLRTARRAWEHPERVAPARHSRPVELGGKLATIVGTALVTQAVRKAAKKLVG